MTHAQEQFQDACRKAMACLDDGALESLTFTIEAHVQFKEHHGYSATEKIAGETEADQRRRAFALVKSARPGKKRSQRA